ncbi:hypothetical protein [Janibacter limosus]|uniref:Uncharacterized protein n=2 Tax=Janibacter limosus TaxID=53458 RepID=A0AC61U3D4_9MICO|nr:hypothetical protein [Janibacter limosus]QBF44798.1 hypothetical protein EXU32_00010 [Janibacter limosus]UUZ44551.1 hypothetical protein LP422_19635 [Janibacter limosus]
MEKLWMTYINALRPAANRHWGAGPDSDHHRMAAELAAMSQDDTRTKQDLIDSVTSAPQYHAPYDHRMSDRFHPVLSTR